ncbi:NAD(P)-binding protein [Aaosphaeria arxii CBS 175.79]|uniref:NAD(P)-binding protein n=1 Tax=Aaosphaeria arxii CBS 175.79 TaxID=1450172 RepID=A0A6A5Y0H3_9PLEO|nr:NAD(P)-binding protein [Aaosphaeria arxii CBS 175.79]KAF2018759.1 NAD(P)-binding protein [Aaosphaeria arxii CBS 175.79]
MSAQNASRLGWIGLGSMGLAMATNIQKHLNENEAAPLRYFNRTISRGEALKEIGGVPGDSIAKLTNECDIIFISVSNDEVAKSVINDILASDLTSPKIIVDTTTVHPDTSASLSEQVLSADHSYVAAPVFGAKPVAEAGQLLVAVAGQDSAVEAITPYLQGVLARSVIRVGTDPSKALLLKTTSNFLTAGMMYLVSEAHTLAEKSGLSTSVLESLIEQNFGAYAGGVSKRMTQGVYFPAQGEGPYSDLDLGIKDVGHGLGIARDNDMTLEVGELSMRAMEKAREYGVERGRKLDSSSVYGAVRLNAGLEFENDTVKRRDVEKR